jgi:hypothetical protein
MEYRLFTIVRYNYNYRDYNKKLNLIKIYKCVQYDNCNYFVIYDNNDFDLFDLYYAWQNRK